MPKHIIECYKHGHREERDIKDINQEFKCSICKGKARIVYDWGKMQIEVFQPFVDKIMADKPVKIESKQHWAKECEKHGVVSHALASGYKTYGARREI
jgi:hypothetical protein